MKRDVEMRVKFDEELTFDPCLEFRVRSTFSGLYVVFECEAREL